MPPTFASLPSRISSPCKEVYVCLGHPRASASFRITVASPTSAARLGPMGGSRVAGRPAARPDERALPQEGGRSSPASQPTASDFMGSTSSRSGHSGALERPLFEAAFAAGRDACQRHPLLAHLAHRPVVGRARTEAARQHGRHPRGLMRTRWRPPVHFLSVIFSESGTEQTVRSATITFYHRRLSRGIYRRLGPRALSPSCR